MNELTPETPRELLRPQDGFYFDCYYCGEVQRIDANRPVFVHADDCSLADFLRQLAADRKRLEALESRTLEDAMLDALPLFDPMWPESTQSAYIKRLEELWLTMTAKRAALAAGEKKP